MDYTNFVINNNQYKQIVQDFESGRENHAYMLCSADLNFANAIAHQAAAFITKSSLERINKNIHPDVFVYGINGKIDVAAVNEILADISVSPYEADKKVYCLLSVESMNDTSQNKILKSLEEPPKNVIFVLTCANTKNVLSTILSRVKTLNIDSLKPDEILSLLRQNGVSQDAANIAVACSNQNSTLAEKLTAQSFLKMYESIFDMLENLKSSRDCLKFAHIFEAKTIDKNEFLDVCVLLLRDISMILSGNNSLVVNKHHEGALNRISQQFSLQATTNIISECLRLKEDLYYNTNTTAVLDQFLLRLAQEKVKCKK